MKVSKLYGSFNLALCVAVVIVLLLSVTVLHAAAIATLRNVVGPVDLLIGGALPASPAKNDGKLASGDMIRTKTGGFAEVVYNDGTVLHISPRSRVDIGEHFSGKNANGSEVHLVRGKVQAIVDLKNAKASGPGPKKFEVRTPNAIAGVRGTDFVVSHEQSTTGVFVRSGSVYSFNPQFPSRLVTLTAGTITTVTGRGTPTPPRPALMQEIQKMEQGITAPPSSGASSGGGSGSAGEKSGETGGTTGGGTPGKTAASEMARTSNDFSSTGAAISVNTLAQGAGQVLSQATITPQSTHSASTTPVSATIAPPPRPTATKVNVNVGIHFN